MIQCDALNENDKRMIEERVSKILNYLEQEPKGLAWKMRARIGTKRMWYNEVEDWKFFRSGANEHNG